MKKKLKWAMMSKRTTTTNVIRTLILICIVATSITSTAQLTLLNKNVRKQTLRNEKPEQGPNARFFTSSFYGLSFVLPIMENDSMAIRTNASSHQWLLGSRYKLKLNEFFALGSDIFYMRQSFRIKQDSATNLLSLGYENDKQRFSFHTLGLGLHVRINFNQRGNYLGKYLDLGAEGHYVLGERLFARNNVDATLNNGSKNIRVSQSKLDYTKDLQQYAVVRFGWSKILLTARYRFSDIFTASQNMNNGHQLPELPRLSVGLEIMTWSNTKSKHDDTQY